jgi:hypothetical protein
MFQVINDQRAKSFTVDFDSLVSAIIIKVGITPLKPSEDIKDSEIKNGIISDLQTITCFHWFSFPRSQVFWFSCLFTNFHESWRKGVNYPYLKKIINFKL